MRPNRNVGPVVLVVGEAPLAGASPLQESPDVARDLE